MVRGVLSESIIGRAQTSGVIEVECHNIRDYTTNKHRRTDDTPYGGGWGMVMSCQPILDCYNAVTGGEKVFTVYMSPGGKKLTQRAAMRMAKQDRMVILCGHYEGVDQRVIDSIVDCEISIGDYVLTGGELPAAVLIDCVSRLIPGVLPDDECHRDESIESGFLEYPQYTRPYEFHGVKVPDVLISGHHANIAKWREEQSIKLTREKRPDLLEKK